MTVKRLRFDQFNLLAKVILATPLEQDKLTLRHNCVNKLFFKRKPILLHVHASQEKEDAEYT